MRCLFSSISRKVSRCVNRIVLSWLFFRERRVQGGERPQRWISRGMRLREPRGGVAAVARGCLWGHSRGAGLDFVYLVFGI